LQLEQLRCNNTFTFKIDTEQLDPDFDRIPTLLVQPLVENSIKHGLIHKQPNGFVHVKFIGKDNALVITVEDNGIGRSAAGKIKSGEHGSKALQLTELRMQLHNERKDLLANYPLHIHDKVDESGEPSGTIVTLTVPVLQFVKEG
jgi:LytS/YehU family sensor histidine kinase